MDSRFTKRALIGVAITASLLVGAFYAASSSNGIGQLLSPNRSNHERVDAKDHHRFGGDKDRKQPKKSHLQSDKKPKYKGEGPTPDPYVGSSGTVSSKLMSDFKLPPEQFRAIQTSTSKYWTAMASWAAKNVYLDEEASKGNSNGADIFRIPAMSEEDRKSIAANLSADIDKISGKTVAEAVSSSFLSSHGFGNMGKYDVVLEFAPLTSVEVDINGNQAEPTISTTDYRISYRYIDPVTGAVKTRRSGDLQEVQDAFGNIFQRNK